MDFLSLLTPEYFAKFGMAGIFIIFILLLGKYIKSKDNMIMKFILMLGELKEVGRDNYKLLKDILKILEDYKKYGHYGKFFKDVYNPTPDMCHKCDLNNKCIHPNKYHHEKK